MMDKEQLRKADIFSGALILLIGILIISQAVQMPMTDSYGGVQNVWYVSPALFPLFVGAMLCLLGAMLMGIAFKEVGIAGIGSVLRFLNSSDLVVFLKQERTFRFYAVVFNLLFFVFLLVPRVDFFPAAIYFLLALFFMFYLGDHTLLVRVFNYTITSALLVGSFFLFRGDALLASVSEFSGDWLLLILLTGLCLLGYWKSAEYGGGRARFRNCLIIGFSAPLTVGIIFKYFLLVPMPFEGLFVWLLDLVWYADFWS